MLTVEGLRIRQGAFRLDADWSVGAGARVALIGPSGSGKSTLISAIAGFVAPDAGRVLWNGTDLSGLAPGARPMSILFQDNNLFAHLTVAENLALGIRPDLKLTADDKRRIADALAQVELGGFDTRRPAQLSGGEAARVALARVLLRARPVLLLDEPFAALGPGLKKDMLSLVRRVADENGALVVMVSHDPEDARRFADQTVFVSDGVAAAPAPTCALLDAPPPGLRAYLGS